jgi:hypothetical protein
MRVLLALVEASLLLLLLDLRVGDGALLVRLVHSGVADVGLSRHDVCVGRYVVWGFVWEKVIDLDLMCLKAWCLFRVVCQLLL